MKNTYWNNEGQYQKEYDEMRKAGHKFTKNSQAVCRRYYRYYNDGDIPRGMYWDRQLVIEWKLERQANEMVKKEYARFTNKNSSK